MIGASGGDFDLSGAGFSCLVAGDFNCIDRPQEKGVDPSRTILELESSGISLARMVLWILASQVLDLPGITISRRVSKFGNTLIMLLLN